MNSSVDEFSLEQLDGAPSISMIWDGGAGDDKVIILGGKRFSIPSAVASVSLNQRDFDAVPKKKEDKIVIKWQGRQYAIGNLALQQRKAVMRRLDQEGLGREVHKAILIGSLAFGAPSRACVRLITNIPIDFWPYRERMLALRDVYQGEYAGKQFYYLINEVEINPETRGIIIAHCFDKDGKQVFSFENRNVCVWDCGTHTINVGIYKGLKFDPDLSFTISNTGYITVWEHCSDVIYARTDRRPDENDIEAAMRFNAGLLHWGADSFDLVNDPELAPEGYKIVASKIVAETQNRLQGGTLFQVAIGGGGLYPQLIDYLFQAFPRQLKRPESFPAIRKVEPWMYNAVGLERRELNRALRAQNG